MALPKLGPTGKKIATGAAVAGVLTLAGIGISKKAERKRVLSTEGDMDKKYPFSENCLEMQNILKSAKLALSQMESESGGDAGAKRVRARQIAALKGRIVEIEKYSLSLDCSNLLLSNEGLVQESPASTTSNTTKYLLYGVAGVILLVVFSNLMRKKD
jgi:hypothetical protein